MKRKFMFWVTALVILMTSFYCSCSQKNNKKNPVAVNNGKQTDREIIKVSVVDLTEEKVQVREKAGAGFRTLQFGESLKAPAEIKVAEQAYCILLLPDETTIKIAENSLFKLSSIKKTEKKFNLGWGKIWVNIGKFFDRNGSFEVETTTTLAAVRGTIFGIDSSESHDQISVYEGKVQVDNLITRKGENISENMSVISDRTGFKSSLAINLEEKDSWVKWNMDVDEKIAQLNSQNPPVAMNEECLARDKAAVLLKAVKREATANEKDDSVSTPAESPASGGAGSQTLIKQAESEPEEKAKRKSLKNEIKKIVKDVGNPYSQK
ncbi:MAG: FecR domain-containing protein [Vulcanimicrobiota bacterium]